MAMNTKRNPLARRLYDFTVLFPPFHLMKEHDVYALCETARVKHLKVDQYLFEADQPVHDTVYLLKEGAVHIQSPDERLETLLEVHDEGDVIGLRPLISGDRYAASAIASEESFVYCFSVPLFIEIMNRTPAVSHYLLRTYAAMARSRYESVPKARLYNRNSDARDDTFPLIEVQTVGPFKAPIYCSPEHSVIEAIQLMSEKKVGSMIICNEHKVPLGIFTDKDVRDRLANGPLDLQAPVKEIMTEPVISAPVNSTVADIQILMMKKGIHHICITQDGTNTTSLEGVVSDHDLLVLQANNPATLIRQIVRAQSSLELKSIRDKVEQLLKKYIYQDVNISFISTIISEVNDAIIRRAHEMVEQEMLTKNIEKPESTFCWIALGSEGREEQLLRTDQDNAIILDIKKGEDDNAVKKYYLNYAQRITEILNDVGYAYCPANMMASNPEWCLDINEWKTTFDKWIQSGTPESLLHANIFFDFRPIYGDLKLVESLSEYLVDALYEKSMFFSRLAKNAQQNPPPLTFFRNFVVERSGAHKDRFDIKQRAMMPLVDAARVLILHKGIVSIQNTVSRFHKMAELEPQNADVYLQAADAYEVFMRYRALQGLRDHNSGRYFDPAQLHKLERMNLRNSFKPVADIQTLLETRFQTAFLG